MDPVVDGAGTQTKSLGWVRQAHCKSAYERKQGSGAPWRQGKARMPSSLQSFAIPFAVVLLGRLFPEHDKKLSSSACQLPDLQDEPHMEYVDPQMFSSSVLTWLRVRRRFEWKLTF